MKILVLTHSYGANGAAAILKSTLQYWANNLGWQIDTLLNEESYPELFTINKKKGA